MDIVLRAIALMKLKLGYPVKLSNTCQRLLNIKPRSLFRSFVFFKKQNGFRSRDGSNEQISYS